MKTLKTIKNWFLLEYLTNTPDFFVQKKIELTFRICVISSIAMLLTIFFVQSFDWIIVGLALLASCMMLTSLFILKYAKDYRLAMKVSVLTMFVCLVAANLKLHTPNLLGMGIWYIVVMVIASFVLGRRWSSFIMIGAILAITLLTGLAYFDDSSIGIATQSDQQLLLTPIRIAVPFYLIHLLIGQYIKNKQRTEKKILSLLQQQEQLNQKLKDSESDYTNLVEQVDDFVYKLSPQGDFMQVNKAMCDATGFSKEEFRQMSFTDNIDPSDKADHIASYKESIERRVTSLYREFVIVTKSGKGIWLGRKSRMNYDEKGQLIEVLCVARDITKEKEIKEKLILANNKLEQVSKYRIQFLSSISHEIRTPINAIVGITHLLLEQGLSAEQRQQLKTLKYSARNVIQLLQEMSDFNKMESGELAIEREPFSLDRLVKSVYHGNVGKAFDKGLYFNFQLDSKIPYKFIGDQLKLTQILNCLVLNAIEYTNEGGVTILIQLQKELEHECVVTFQIQDTGLGIAKDKQKRIFDKFSQGSDSNIRQGFGIGLSMVKELLELQDSQIEIESELGKGATFSFQLAFKKMVQKPEAKTHLDEGLLPTILEDSMKGLSLLMVEDNKMNQLVTKKILQKWGISIDIAENGKQGVEIVQMKHYDVVLMDLQMPIMNGIEATQKIRALGEPYASIPIIALTASVVSEIRKECENVGFNTFMTKPFIPNHLYLEIQKQLNSPDTNILQRAR